MNDFKATGVAYIRNRIRTETPQLEERFSEQLNEADRSFFENAMPVSWIPVQAGARIYAAAAELLFPSATNPLKDLGRAMALADLRGIYKILLKAATVPMVVKKTASLWRIYHKRGEARSERGSNKNEIFLVISDYRDLPGEMRETATGYTAGVIELTGARNVKVDLNDEDPERWRWSIRWD
jgi:hypothetical protein